MNTNRKIAVLPVGVVLALLLSACAGKINSVGVANTLPGQQKTVLASVKKNYDTVQGKSVAYQVDGGTSVAAPPGQITSSGGNTATYRHDIPGSEAWQPGQTLTYDWQFTFNRGGVKTTSGTFTVPPVPDLRLPIPAISFSAGGGNLPGNPGSSNPAQQPVVGVGQPFTVRVHVENLVAAPMPEPFVVKLGVVDETTGQLVEEIERIQQGLPQGTPITVQFGYQFDTPTTLIFSAMVDADEQLPEISEDNNLSPGFYRLRVVQ